MMDPIAEASQSRSRAKISVVPLTINNGQARPDRVSRVSTVSQFSGSRTRKPSSLLSTGSDLPSLTTIIMLKRKVSDMRGRRRERHIEVEPTYRLEPKDSERFQISKVVQTVNACHNFFLKGRVYEPLKCASLCKLVSDDVRSQLNAPVICPRYKVVVYTLVFPLHGTNGLHLSSRSLMNADTDDYVSVEYQNHSLRAITLVYWIYRD